MHESQAQIHIDEVADQGFTILENIAAPERVDAIRKRVREIERDTLRPLEPGETEEDSSFFRTGGLLRIDPLFWDVPIEPDVVQVLEGVLGEDFLLSTFSGIDTKPQSNSVQPLHPDDALVPIARPRPNAIGATVMWAIDPFNKASGGTRLLPGSHKEPLDLLWSQDEERLSQVIHPDVKSGSCLIFDHALFHGAPNNPSENWRLGLQVSYHAGYIRPYTNWFRSVPIEEAREFPQRLQDLLGYKSCNGIGGASLEMGTYRESYQGKGRKRDPRLAMDY